MTKEEAIHRFKHSLKIKKTLQEKLKYYEGIDVQTKFQKACVHCRFNRM